MEECWGSAAVITCGRLEQRGRSHWRACYVVRDIKADMCCQTMGALWRLVEEMGVPAFGGGGPRWDTANTGRGLKWTAVGPSSGLGCGREFAV
ncbi:hypothetical protein NDU88_001648 [Pleurodeles waltl]|uniref:Uncharacterized protein n=1 Tax=Pleurodeles waltl TaxID=8319 RepID=A0AAV7VAV8_PLEWA|nr:hypothetical protein NDU88_001648 [Pleurodeles waltl]